MPAGYVRNELSLKSWIHYFSGETKMWVFLVNVLGFRLEYILSLTYLLKMHNSQPFNALDSTCSRLQQHVHNLCNSREISH